MISYMHVHVPVARYEGCPIPQGLLAALGLIDDR